MLTIHKPSEKVHALFDLLDSTGQIIFSNSFFHKPGTKKYISELITKDVLCEIIKLTNIENLSDSEQRCGTILYLAIFSLDDCKIYIERTNDSIRPAHKHKKVILLNG